MSYWVINVAIALVTLLLTRYFVQGDSRFRLHLVLLSLVAWLVPWPLLIEPFSQWLTAQSVLADEVILLWVGQSNPALAAPLTAWSLSISEIADRLLAIAIGIGALVAAVELTRFTRTSKKNAGHYKFSIKPRRLRIPHHIQVVFSATAETANMSGWLTVTIVIPEHYSKQQQQLALHHEFNHLRNGDSYWLLAIFIVQRLFWWNPLVWLQANSARQFLEMRCDEHCLQRFDRDDYITTLATLSLAQKRHAEAALSMPLPAGKSLLRLRMENLAVNTYQPWKKTFSGFLLFGLTVTMLTAAAVNSAAPSASNLKDEKFSESYLLSEEQAAAANLTKLQLVYQFVANDSDDKRSIEVSFKSARALVERLYQLSRELPVDITTRTEQDTQVINLIVRDESSHAEIVKLFSGTQLAPLLDSTAAKEAASNDTFELALEFQVDQKPARKFSLVVANGQWAEFKDEEFRIQLRPSLTTTELGKRVLLDAKLYKTNVEKSVLISEPQLLTMLDSEAVIEVGERDKQQKFTGFRLAILPSVQ
ncbi:MAG: M56 family metallopeptidase [Gammaproteobacteria bacterium]|nr:M56 family metallopeptidase [Gammaproteobacteria bacterium]NVK88937.1 M56 family metallopeptidase [Gammaproteobacteria bacterium]